MNIEILRYPTDADWERCLYLARITQGKDDAKVPSDAWKKKILAAEHSPVRTLMYTVVMRDIPYYCSVHLVRHKFGIEHYVRSQRVNPDRGAERQDAPVTHVMDMNFQALVNLCRKRLCYKADATTRSIAVAIVEELRKVDPISASFCVPECIYRGKVCHELRPCGKYEWGQQ